MRRKRGPWRAVIWRAAAALAVGVAATAGMVAVAVRQAGRGQTVGTASIADTPGGNVFLVMFERDRWATSVQLKCQSLGDVEESASMVDELARLKEEGPTWSQSTTYARPPQIPPPWLGEVMSDAPPAAVVMSGGWGETTYGWPVRCLRVRGWLFAAKPPSQGKFWPQGLVAGRSAWTLAAKQTAASVGAVSGMVFVGLTIVGRVRARSIRRRRASRGECLACGYQAGGVPGVCPECGAAPADA